jgi:hypothetical protein
MRVHDVRPIILAVVTIQAALTVRLKRQLKRLSERTMTRWFIASAACLMLASCGGSSGGSSGAAVNGASNTAFQELAAVDYAAWRDVGSDNKRHMSLAMMCAGRLAGLEAADPSLKDKVALQLPWVIQVSKRGKLQAQCEWAGPDQRTGRIVVDVLCANDERDRCSRYAYATEGGRKLDAVAIQHHPQPPVSSAYPPGHDDTERRRSQTILAWALQNASDHIGALRVEFRSTRVGIVQSAKTPFVCGQIREVGKEWRRFAVYSLGAAASPPSPTFYWLREPRDKSVHDFCDTAQVDLQWYAVPDRLMNGG